MKVVKGLAILSFFSILFGSCFDPPEFPDAPEIAFERVVFRDVADESRPDSLIIYITFKDGDGDLGLSPEDPDHFNTPFHYARYFQTNATGELVPLQITSTNLGSATSPDFVDVLQIDNPAAGQLVFARTRENPLYSSLPSFNEVRCGNYEPGNFIIAQKDTLAVDLEGSDFIDTLFRSGDNAVFYLVNDTLYIESNPNHYNIEVDFLIKDPSSSDPDHPGFTEFDWRKEFCATFDGRFPILSENDNAALDGNLKYNMESRGFKILFGNKTMKLRVQIKDRKLNVSNTIDSEEFTLESIRG
jgi:hypothetical protein